MRPEINPFEPRTTTAGTSPARRTPISRSSSPAQTGCGAASIPGRFDLFDRRKDRLPQEFKHVRHAGLHPHRVRTCAWKWPRSSRRAILRFRPIVLRTEPDEQITRALLGRAAPPGTPLLRARGYHIPRGLRPARARAERDMPADHRLHRRPRSANYPRPNRDPGGLLVTRQRAVREAAAVRVAVFGRFDLRQSPPGPGTRLQARSGRPVLAAVGWNGRVGGHNTRRRHSWWRRVSTDALRNSSTPLRCGSSRNRPPRVHHSGVRPRPWWNARPPGRCLREPAPCYPRTRPNDEIWRDRGARAWATRISGRCSGPPDVDEPRRFRTRNAGVRLVARQWPAARRRG